MSAQKKYLESVHRGLSDGGKSLKRVQADAADIIYQFQLAHGDGPLAATLKRVHWTLRNGNAKQLDAVHKKAANLVREFIDNPPKPPKAKPAPAEKPPKAKPAPAEKPKAKKKSKKKSPQKTE